MENIKPTTNKEEYILPDEYYVLIQTLRDLINAINKLRINLPK